MEKAALDLDLPLAREAFIDREYEDDGNLTPRSIDGSVIRDPDHAAKRAVQMVRDGKIVSRQGKAMDIPFVSLCLHGDEPTAVPLAKAVMKALDEADIALVTLPNMLEQQTG